MGLTGRRERLLLDTSFASIWSTPLVSDRVSAAWPEGLVERIDAADLAVSVVTVGELRAGRLRARWGERRQQQADWRLQRCAQLSVDRRVAEQWARLRAHGQDRGQAFGDNDLWIAATSRALGAAVVTCDRDFLRMQDLGVRVVFAPSTVSTSTR